MGKLVTLLHLSTRLNITIYYIPQGALNRLSVNQNWGIYFISSIASHRSNRQGFKTNSWYIAQLRLNIESPRIAFLSDNDLPFHLNIKTQGLTFDPTHSSHHHPNSSACQNTSFPLLTHTPTSFLKALPIPTGPQTRTATFRFPCCSNNSWTIALRSGRP